jgi:hypothetical protein
MRLGLAHRAHLVEHDRHAALHELPGRFAPCKATADDVNFGCHGWNLARGAGAFKREERPTIAALYG